MGFTEFLAYETERTQHTPDDSSQSSKIVQEDEKSSIRFQLFPELAL